MTRTLRRETPQHLHSAGRFEQLQSLDDIKVCLAQAQKVDGEEIAFPPTVGRAVARLDVSRLASISVVGRGGRFGFNPGIKKLSNIGNCLRTAIEQFRKFVL